MAAEHCYTHRDLHGVIVTKRERAQRTIVVMAGSWNYLVRLHVRIGPQGVQTLLTLCTLAQRGKLPPGGMY